jgi:hypothetical protein
MKKTKRKYSNRELLALRKDFRDKAKDAKSDSLRRHYNGRASSITRVLKKRGVLDQNGKLVKRPPSAKKPAPRPDTPSVSPEQKPSSDRTNDPPAEKPQKEDVKSPLTQEQQAEATKQLKVGARPRLKIAHRFMKKRKEAKAVADDHPEATKDLLRGDDSKRGRALLKKLTVAAGIAAFMVATTAMGTGGFFYTPDILGPMFGKLREQSGSADDDDNSEKLMSLIEDMLFNADIPPKVLAAAYREKST